MVELPLCGRARRRLHHAHGHRRLRAAGRLHVPLVRIDQRNPRHPDRGSTITQMLVSGLGTADFSIHGMVMKAGTHKAMRYPDMMLQMMAGPIKKGVGGMIEQKCKEGAIQVVGWEAVTVPAGTFPGAPFQGRRRRGMGEPRARFSPRPVHLQECRHDGAHRSRDRREVVDHRNAAGDALMDRRAALRLLGATTAAATATDLDALGRALHRRLGRGAPLRVLDPHQNATVIALSDVILPATDTPGAKAALVNEFIDLLLAEWYEPEDRDRILGRSGRRGHAARGPRSGRTSWTGRRPSRPALLTALDDAAARWNASPPGDARSAAVLPRDQVAHAVRLLHVRNRRRAGTALRDHPRPLRPVRAGRHRRAPE